MGALGIFGTANPQSKAFGLMSKLMHRNGHNQQTTTGLALPQQPSGPLASKGMPAMPGQSPLGMSVNAPPGASLQASQGQKKSYLG